MLYAFPRAALMNVWNAEKSSAGICGTPWCQGYPLKTLCIPLYCLTCRVTRCGKATAHVRGTSTVHPLGLTRGCGGLPRNTSEVLPSLGWGVLAKVPPKWAPSPPTPVRADAWAHKASFSAPAYILRITCPYQANLLSVSYPYPTLSEVGTTCFFYHIVIMIRQLFLRPAACLTSNFEDGSANRYWFR
jgi:hypothetical protein